MARSAPRAPAAGDGRSNFVTPLLIEPSAVGFVCVLFGVFETGSGGQAASTAFEFVWELSFGIYLVVKGFRPSAVASCKIVTQREG